jgi:nitroreductase
MNAIYMDTFDAINQRRSVKAFDPTRRFTAAQDPAARHGLDGAVLRRQGAAAAGQTIMLAARAVKPAMPKGGQLALSEVVVQDRFA